MPGEEVTFTGYAQGTGEATLVNLHTSPGLGNAMGAIVTAWHNRTPLVITAGQQDRRHIALDPMLSGDLVGLAKPYVKLSHEPYQAEDVPAYDDGDCEEVAAGLEWLLDEGHWEAVAEAAHQYVLACHTWAQRARELYGMLLDVFPHLREGREAWWYEA